MKIILSRKGTDSRSGGMPGIFIRDESKIIISFPIPLEDNIKYSDLKYDEKNYAQIIKELNPDFHHANCHLDPDLIKEVKTRGKWKAAFGQEGAPASHLDNQGVQAGDIFLFFGWFREAIKEENGQYKFLTGEPDLHMIYGYLQVGEILREPEKMKEALPDHPHSTGIHPKNNRIYVAAKYLFDTSHPGAGVFDFNNALILTKQKNSNGSESQSNEYEPRSHWKNFLPKDKFDVTFHNNRNEELDYFPCVRQGQEFVITSQTGETDSKKKHLSEHHLKQIKKWIIERIENKN